MMAGFDFSRGDIIIPMDGDLQNNPQDIPKLIERLEQGFDLVSGWRQNRKDNKFSRVLISRIANFLISHISGVKLHDYGCTLKAYRREIIQDVKLYGEMHRFIPIYAKWEGAKIDEISVSHRERINGKSKYGLNRVVKVILDLIVVQFLFHYSKKPIYLFGSFGLILILLAFAAIGYALFQKFVFGLSLILTPLPVLASMLFITGITSILMGLLAELITRTYHETQNKPTYAVAKKINF
jgi:glycosyltransferase involved in cell wall biosynthesis